MADKTKTKYDLIEKPNLPSSLTLFFLENVEIGLSENTFLVIFKN